MTTLDLFAAHGAPNPLGLPERVRVLSLWWEWAQRVRSGDKTTETRRWPWPYEPGWLAIHAAKRGDGDVAGERVPFSSLPPCESVVPGSLCALVWVAECRQLVRADLPRSLVYNPGLWAWNFDEKRTRRLRPTPMPGPRKFGSLPRAAIYDALEPNGSQEQQR